MIASVTCISDRIILPFKTIEEVFIYKQDFAYFVIFIDLLVIISIVVFFSIIKQRQLEFIKAFKVQTI